MTVTNEMLWEGYKADDGIEKDFETFMSLCPGWREDQAKVYLAMRAIEPSTPPREVTEAMVETAIEAYFTFHHEYFVDDTDDHWTSGVYRHGDVTNHRFWGPGEKRDARDWLERAAKQAARAALNAPARTASDLNIERQVAGLDDIDRDDAAKWRAVSAECEKAGCCLLNAPPQVGGNITHAHCYICGWSGQTSCERPDCPTKELVANGAARVDENALPMELLPEGWHFELLRRQLSLNHAGERVDRWIIMIQWWEKILTGSGPTIRAAMIAAIEAARERGDG